jgi:hypothetical protein
LNTEIFLDLSPFAPEIISPFGKETVVTKISVFRRSRCVVVGPEGGTGAKTENCPPSLRIQFLAED